MSFSHKSADGSCWHQAISTNLETGEVRCLDCGKTFGKQLSIEEALVQEAGRAYLEEQSRELGLLREDGSPTKDG